MIFWRTLTNLAIEKQTEHWHSSKNTKTECCHSLRAKWPNTEFFLIRLFLYSDWTQETKDRKKNIFRHFLRGDFLRLNLSFFNVYVDKGTLPSVLKHVNIVLVIKKRHRGSKETTTSKYSALFFKIFKKLLCNEITRFCLSIKGYL